jgi:hypothetical protein
VNQGKCKWAPGVVCGLLMGTLFLVGGCHARSGDATLLERIERIGHTKIELQPGVLAEKGRAEITDECAKQSYETARKGMIVSETALHEDVFAMRDRVSYGEDAYGLDEALRLESLLRAEAAGLGHPTEQARCIREFADHLEALTEPIIEAEERQRELDITAFKDSAKEAQELADKRPSESEKAAEPRTQAPGSTPR